MAAGDTRMAPGMKYAREASQSRHQMRASRMSALGQKRTLGGQVMRQLSHQLCLVKA